MGWDTSGAVFEHAVLSQEENWPVCFGLRTGVILLHDDAQPRAPQITEDDQLLPLCRNVDEGQQRKGGFKPPPGPGGALSLHKNAPLQLFPLKR